jgi:hypothetical protein
MANKPWFVLKNLFSQWRTFTAVFIVMLTLTLSEEHKDFSLPEKLFQQVNDRIIPMINESHFIYNECHLLHSHDDIFF